MRRRNGKSLFRDDSFFRVQFTTLNNRFPFSMHKHRIISLLNLLM